MDAVLHFCELLLVDSFLRSSGSMLVILATA